MEEKAFGYWYVTQVIEEHLRCLDDWMPVVSKGMLSLPSMPLKFINGTRIHDI